MTDRSEEIESTDDSGRLDRRTVLKGAAAGLAGTVATGTASAGGNTITLEADDRPVKYRIVVSGEIRKGAEAGGTDHIVDSDVAIGVMKKTEEINDVKDGYEFTGQITDFDVLEGSLNRVWVNGERVDPDDLGDSDTSGATVLEDFEDGRWPDDWTGETNFYSVTTDAVRGTHSLEATHDYVEVAKPSVSSPRGHTYALRTIVSGGDFGNAWLTTNVQDRNQTFDDCYGARLYPHHDNLQIVKRENENFSILATTNVDLESGTEYRLVCDVDTDRVRARVLDADGEELAATDWVTDTTHTGGFPGIYTGGRNGTGTRYDELTKHPLGEL